MGDEYDLHCSDGLSVPYVRLSWGFPNLVGVFEGAKELFFWMYLL